MKLTKTDIEIAKSAMRHLVGFVNRQQFDVISGLLEEEEGQFFKDKVLELSTVVLTMPVTYETDGQGDQAMVHLHYFTASADWYITERDCEAQELQAFGMADLGVGYPELGYISIVELLEAGAELDLHWQLRSLAAI